MSRNSKFNPNYGKKSQALNEILAAYESYFGRNFKDTAEIRACIKHVVDAIAKSPRVNIRLDSSPKRLSQRPFENINFNDLGELEE